MSESENKPLAECECHLEPDFAKGWKLVVCGCEKELEEIEEKLGPHARAYFESHLKKKVE